MHAKKAITACPSKNADWNLVGLRITKQVYQTVIRSGNQKCFNAVRGR
jgi:hypothetical protein